MACDQSGNNPTNDPQHKNPNAPVIEPVTGGGGGGGGGGGAEPPDEPDVVIFFDELTDRERLHIVWEYSHILYEEDWRAHRDELCGFWRELSLTCAPPPLDPSSDLAYFLFGDPFSDVLEAGPSPRYLRYLAGLTDDVLRQAARSVPSQLDRMTAQLTRLGLPSSRVLAKNMEALGVTRPLDSAAHHIVAGSARAATAARAKLKALGIDINDAANGVFLPKNSQVANPSGAAVHSTLHTRAYYQSVERLLLGASSKDEALEVLSFIRTQLQRGSWP
jgi:hypothetical protein